MYGNPLFVAARWTAFVVVSAVTVVAAEPVRLHPENPRYFLFRGRPAVLMTSGEHYGAVVNLDFDYRKYLDTLQSHGFNLTRTFAGSYCEVPGAFKIEDDTLAPAPGRFVCPWARSDTPGYARGGNKFDLTRWDPRYFERLRDFLAEAGRRGIVVEFVFFSPFYEDAMWAASPLNAANNVNGVGAMPHKQVYRLDDAKMLAVQEAMVRRVVEALRDVDNLYYEICNEPYHAAVGDDWQARIADVIRETERDLPHPHLIAQNIANKSRKVARPNPHVSVFNFHYARPEAVAANWDLERPIVDDETGFKGDEPGPYRIEAWQFMLAGGAGFSNLDYSFTCGREDGTANLKAPGSRGPVIRRQIAILKRFLENFDLVRLQPASTLVQAAEPVKLSVQALAEPGRRYAVHLAGQGPATLHLDFPAGEYAVEWIDTTSGDVVQSEPIRVTAGPVTLRSPRFSEDIALRISRASP